MSLAFTVHTVLQERRVATTKKKSHIHFSGNFSTNHNQARPSEHEPRKLEAVPLMA